ncbi:uncharacterized protein LOC133711096 [Rosa rugosa]|uniref:uncharacterized protein LOC133711096 n=1 Tax=Rosa rugosa TaxID=74645 RepID=UPI002B415B92|nr:uncharacterized protein LOC133711096 [Rosa rugosa]
MAKALNSNYLSIRSRSKNKQQVPFVILNSNQDIVFLILDKLKPIDLLRFAAVCKECLALSKEYNLTAQRWSNQVVPMLSTLKEEKLRLYSACLCAGKIYDNIQLSVPPDKSFCGSSHGWLATVDTFNTYVVKPVWLYNSGTLSEKLQGLLFVFLPCSTCCWCYDLRKVILLVDPSMNGDNNYMVVALTTYNLALFRAGQKDWTCIRNLKECNDVVLYKSRIYGVGRRRCLWSLKVNHSSTETHSSPPSTELIAPENCTDYKLERGYIVESNTTGDLLLVQRTCNLQTPYP